MANITVTQKKEDMWEWEFEVAVKEGGGLSAHAVSLSKAYWQAMTGGRESPMSLVRRSFEFLLAREPKESILTSFDLSFIKKYFSEYEEIIKKV